MAKFAHKLCLPNVVLAPVLALLKQRGLRTHGSPAFGFTINDDSSLAVTVGKVKLKTYTFNLKTDSRQNGQCLKLLISILLVSDLYSN